jgi:CheY-like chemotaxis protein
MLSTQACIGLHEYGPKGPERSFAAPVCQEPGTPYEKVGNSEKLMPHVTYGGSGKELEEFPTILLADINGAWCSTVISRLEEDKYHILRAQSWDEALHFAKTHSRQIHLLLTEDNRDGRVLAETLKPYRPHMRIIYVTVQSNRDSGEALEPERAAAKVRELLRPLSIKASGP